MEKLMPQTPAAAMQPALDSMAKPERRTKVATKGTGQKVAEYAERISGNWQKAVGSIFKVAADCAAAKNELTRSERLELLERLPFGESMFSKLASIGADNRLNEHQELLPPSISTLYLIQNMSNEQLEAAVTEGALRPDVTRDDLEEWTRGKNDRPARSKSSDLELPAGLYCVYSE